MICPWCDTEWTPAPEGSKRRVCHDLCQECYVSVRDSVSHHRRFGATPAYRKKIRAEAYDLWYADNQWRWASTMQERIIAAVQANPCGLTVPDLCERFDADHSTVWLAVRGALLDDLIADRGETAFMHKAGQSIDRLGLNRQWTGAMMFGRR